MNETLKQLEVLIKLSGSDSKSIGFSLPNIRYFEGTNKFSDRNGWYASDTLEGSLQLYIKAMTTK